jgi:membrane associated rhomboid family serine protease
MEVCYRHPNRETGVRCSNCERPICPDCMTSTPVGMRCPECARQTSRVRTLRSTTNDPQLTYILIGINVIAGIGSLLGGGAGAGSSSLTDDGGLSQHFIAEGEYYRLITAGFLHAGLFHLLTNMLSLWILGSLIEPAVGTWRFAVIYFVSLLCGSFGALLMSPDAITVGASGAIFGLLAAAAVVAWNRGFNLMESGLGLWIGLNLLITFTVPNISVGGHVGGLIGGGIAALLLVELPERIRVPSFVPAAASVVLGAAAVAGSIVISA